MKKVATLALAAVLGMVLTAAADDTAPTALPPASTKAGVTYTTDIKPIFDASCVKCHSGDRAKARLHMDTLDGVLKGTKEGPIVKPGDSSTNSFIIQAVAHTAKDHDSWMPPLNNKAGIKPLTADEIGLIRAWIDQGAK
ncbi:MAG TPA: c-type cytochrome domain-containing protein [Verrucomicrobiae bacterium]